MQEVLPKLQRMCWCNFGTNLTAWKPKRSSLYTFKLHVNSNYIIFTFDIILSTQFIWEPYSDVVVDGMPDYCLQGRQIWRSVVPLICFHIVEWHQPDRVLRQFGFSQPIPQPPRQTADMHLIKLTSSTTNWMTENQHWIML